MPLLHSLLLPDSIPSYGRAHFVYAFSGGGTFTRFMLLGHYEERGAMKSMWQLLCAHMFPFLSGVYWARLSGSSGKRMLKFLGKLPSCFPKWVRHSVFPGPVWEGSGPSPSLSRWFCLSFPLQHPTACEVVARGGCRLHVPKGRAWNIFSSAH